MSVNYQNPYTVKSAWVSRRDVGEINIYKRVRGGALIEDLLEGFEAKKGDALSYITVSNSYWSHKHFDGERWGTCSEYYVSLTLEKARAIGTVTQTA